MNEPQMKLPGFLTILGILALVALTGWMSQRDEHMTEQRQVVMSDCSDVPMIELDMPIEGVRI